MDVGDRGGDWRLKIGGNAPIQELDLARKTLAAGKLMLHSPGADIRKELLVSFWSNLREW
jgi:hypothetical protein